MYYIEIGIIYSKVEQNGGVGEGVEKLSVIQDFIYIYWVFALNIGNDDEDCEGDSTANNTITQK